MSFSKWEYLLLEIIGRNEIFLFCVYIENIKIEKTAFTQMHSLQKFSVTSYTSIFNDIYLFIKIYSRIQRKMHIIMSES